MLIDRDRCYWRVIVCTTGCSGVANLRSPSQAWSKRVHVPPPLDAPRSTLLPRSLHCLCHVRAIQAAISTCIYLVVAYNNIRLPCVHFAVYSTYILQYVQIHAPLQASPARCAPSTNNSACVERILQNSRLVLVKYSHNHMCTCMQLSDHCCALQKLNF